MKEALLTDIMEKNRKNAYSNEKSILKEYDDFLALNGIYRGFDIMTFRKKIRGKTDLCEEIVEIYNKAELENERISLIQDLYAIGYSKDMLVEIILKEFGSEVQKKYLWEYGDLLYRIKNYKYLSNYIDIITNLELKEARQMVILLVGKCKDEDIIPILISLVEDETVYGHTLQALSNFKCEAITRIMEGYTKDKIKWIRNRAEKYLEMYG